MTTLVLVSLAAALGVGLAVAVYWMARPGVDPPPLRTFVPHAPRPGAELLEALAVHLAGPLRPGNRFRMYCNAAEIFPAMLEAVDEAQHSVEFLTYVFWGGDVARRFSEALARAARRGVDVRVLVDDHGTENADELLALIEEAGGKVGHFHRLSAFKLDQLNQRTHRKALVIDHRYGFVGGVGIADEWDDGPHGEAWREDQFRVEGPAVADLLGSFIENWRQATGEVLVVDGAHRREEVGETLAVPLLDQPGGETADFRLALWMGLAAAEHRVRIRTPYFVPGPDLIEAMGEAVARGVKVEVLMPGDDNDSKLVRLASRARYPELVRAGVTLYEYEPSMMHAKGVTVDGSLAVIGSHNVDHRSMRLNFEFSFAVFDPELVRAMNARFDSDLGCCRRIDADAVARRGVGERVGGWCVRKLDVLL